MIGQCVCRRFWYSTEEELSDVPPCDHCGKQPDKDDLYRAKHYVRERQKLKLKPDWVCEAA